MLCRFCRYDNAEEEERCGLCGIRLSGDITCDGISLSGATALAPRRRSTALETGADEAAASVPQKSGRTAAAQADRQTSLFNCGISSNVIPFESFQRPSGSAAAKTDVLQSPEPGPAVKRTAPAKSTSRKQSTNRNANDKGVRETQGSLGLEFLQPAPQMARTLKTTVEASIYCDAQVATPMHRAVALILDAAMILIGCGIFLGIFQAVGGGVRVDRFDVVVFICSLILITMVYGLVFALCGRETAGQNWTELRLINFDGVPPEGTSRALRFAGCWVSFCAGGMGLFWALLDEENLTWHDHMSKTFLTMREADLSFFRERPR